MLLLEQFTKPTYIMSRFVARGLRITEGVEHASSAWKVVDPSLPNVAYEVSFTKGAALQGSDKDFKWVVKVVPNLEAVTWHGEVDIVAVELVTLCDTRDASASASAHHNKELPKALKANADGGFEFAAAFDSYWELQITREVTVLASQEPRPEAA